MHGLGAVLLGLSISLDELAIGFTLGLLRLPAGLVIVLSRCRYSWSRNLGYVSVAASASAPERLAGEVEEELQLRCDIPEPIRRSEGDAVRPLEPDGLEPDRIEDRLCPVERVAGSGREHDEPALLGRLPSSAGRSRRSQRG
jgi:hypothetical protein